MIQLQIYLTYIPFMYALYTSWDVLDLFSLCCSNVNEWKREKLLIHRIHKTTTELTYSSNWSVINKNSAIIGGFPLTLTENGSLWYNIIWIIINQLFCIYKYLDNYSIMHIVQCTVYTYTHSCKVHFWRCQFQMQHIFVCKTLSINLFEWYFIKYLLRHR